MNQNPLIAIDLGSTHISAIGAEERENHILHIIAAEENLSSDVQYGIVEKISNAGFHVNECVKLMQNQIHTDINSVFVGVGGRGMQIVETSVCRYLGNNRLISNKLLEEMETECREKISKQNVHIFDIIPQYYLIDKKHTVDFPEGEKAAELEGFYKVLVGVQTLWENTERCFERTGIIIEHSVSKTDALATALLEDKDREKGCAIIDFGGETTSLHIFKKGKLNHICVVPLGGKHITKDIQSIGISENNAEKLKCIKGQALEKLVENPVYIQIPSINKEEPSVRISTKFLAHIIEARLTEIMSRIITELKKFESELEGDLILTGGGCMLENIIDFIQQYTTLNIRIGSHVEWLSEDTSDKFWAPNYSQLVGTLVLGSFYRNEHKEEQVNAKGPKVPKRKGFINKISDTMLRIFEDDDSTI